MEFNDNLKSPTATGDQEAPLNVLENELGTPSRKTRAATKRNREEEITPRSKKQYSPRTPASQGLDSQSTPTTSR